MKETHKNSKLIQVLRVNTFLDSVQKDAPEFMSMSIKSIGPYWESTTSRMIGSGLTFNEQKLLLPSLIDCPAEDRDFRTKVTEFYSDLITKVPYGDEGLVLEIGLELDNNESVLYRDDKGAQNFPLNLNDYVRYRHIIKSNKVAMNQELARGNQLIEFYIYDPTIANQQVDKVNKLKDRAMQYYFEITNQTEDLARKKVDQMLVLLGINPKEIGTGSDLELIYSQRRAILREQADKNAAKFVEEFKGNHFELKYQLNAFIQAQILEKKGTRIYTKADNKLIAETESDAIKLMQSEEYSDVLVMWNGLYADYLSKADKTAPRSVRRVTNV